MRKTLLNLILALLAVYLSACEAENKKSDTKQSNQALNDDLQADHFRLIQEQSEWVKEKDAFHKRLDTLRSIYAKLRPQPEPGFDELIEKTEKILNEHVDLIVNHSKMTEEHTAVLTKHQEHQISDEQVQVEQKNFYRAHRDIEKKHDEILERYKDVMSKIEIFVTKAGGKVPPMPNAQENQNTGQKENTQSADTAKK